METNNATALPYRVLVAPSASIAGMTIRCLHERSGRSMVRL
jgi:hypothetical protein